MDSSDATTGSDEASGLVRRIGFKVIPVEYPTHVLASGERKYTVSDVEVEERTSKEGQQFWSKTLALTAEWAIGAHVTRDAPEDGFGIYVRGVSASRSFSWNWFTPESQGVYRHIKCGARVNAEFRQLGAESELRQMEFIDDTTLTFQADLMHRSQGHSHELIVRKGSILCISY